MQRLHAVKWRRSRRFSQFKKSPAKSKPQETTKTVANKTTPIKITIETITQDKVSSTPKEKK